MAGKLIADGGLIQKTFNEKAKTAPANYCCTQFANKPLVCAIIVKSKRSFVHLKKENE